MAAGASIWPRDGEARSVHGNYVSGQYFDTLGVHAILGRTLTPADDTRGCAGSAVLSYGFWQSEYGGRADVLGKTDFYRQASDRDRGRHRTGI